MIDDFESKGARSSGELWSEICSNLPEPQGGQGGQAENAQFTDSFQPSAQNSTQANGNHSDSTLSPWEPMADSEIYIASLENRLKRIKGQASEVTSREMLRSLSQAKKECWDRFLHDAQTSEMFQNGGEMDESALEHFKRWLIPEKVAISAEELEYLLRPSQTTEQSGGDASHNGAEEEQEDHVEVDESATPEK